jgi:hypothetical protein
MANKAKRAAAKPKPKLKLPLDAVKMKCVSCKSDEATRAVYQHDHEETVVSFEMPAYTNKEGKVPYNWPCLCGEKFVWALYVECGKCGYIGRVDNVNKRVVPPPKKEA